MWMKRKQTSGSEADLTSSLVSVLVSIGAQSGAVRARPWTSGTSSDLQRELVTDVLGPLRNKPRQLVMRRSRSGPHLRSTRGVNGEWIKKIMPLGAYVDQRTPTP